MKKIKASHIAIIPLALILITLALVKFFQISTIINAFENIPPPVAVVNAVGVERQQWRKSVTALGTVRAHEGITLVAERAGKVKKILFVSGKYVEQGELLLEQDNANEIALFNSAKAQLQLAKSNLSRVSQLRDKNLVAESEHETAQLQLSASIANAENQQATLEKMKIYAPFSGRLGIKSVDLGEDLQAGTAIVSLQSTDALKVDFPISQKWLNQVATGLDVEVSYLESQDVVAKGEINAVGVKVDNATRSILVQATLDNYSFESNKSPLLYPGMAVSVRVVFPQADAVLAIPSTSVIYSAFGDSVYLLQEDEQTGQLHARQQFIKIAQRRGDFVAVEAGLEGDERLASGGAFKLFNGQAVEVGESGETTYSLSPHPKEG
ncbi:MAG TPA: efflux transporter periplasmic adaptor subunit [Cellvibrionales bacterium]|jgi:membrane fusion protein (multidrug efflux system)|nr:efflux transporter periplasmic adaptor subunit [Cellvibrionales bacterium]HCX26556.1 efflux transporter periplasmic adaptor subunit [Cellvibrionales bacterium]